MSGIGDVLRAARERQGRTIEDASLATRVRPDFLRALEQEEFGRFGGDVYAKGFLTTYARWLGLDPAPLLEVYRNSVQPGGGYDPHALIEHNVTRSERSLLPNWLVWSAVGLVALFAALAVIGTFGGRTPQPAAPPQLQAAPVAPAEEPRQVAPAPPPPAPPPAVSPSPGPTAVNVVLLLEDRSWMRVRVADRIVFEGIVASGETKEFQAPDRVFLRLGNAGGVRVLLNGRDLGRLGGRGDVWDGTCTVQACTAEL